MSGIALILSQTWNEAPISVSLDLHVEHLSRVLRKLGIMHVRKSVVPDKPVQRDDTFRFYGIFSFKEVHPYRKSSLGGKCRP